jgi:hypothetical protein
MVQNGKKYTKFPQNITNCHKMYQMAVNRPNGHKIDQHLSIAKPWQDLATLAQTRGVRVGGAE